jgi:broad specificity phosphatase PhoE
MRKIAWALKGLAVLALLTPPPAALAQRAVFVVRHAEKASDANEASVPLSEAGSARAKRLGELLKDAGIAAIYSTDTVRTRKTAEPLANLIKTPVEIYEATAPDGKVSPQGLVERLRREHARDAVLVVGHSNTIGPLLSALGCPEKVEIAADEYDSLFIAVPREAQAPVLLRLRF